MTEREWLRSDNSDGMMTYRGDAYSRMATAMNLACLECVADWLTPQAREWCAKAHSVLDGDALREELLELDHSTVDSLDVAYLDAAPHGRDILHAAIDIFNAFNGETIRCDPTLLTLAEKRRQADVIRDVYGNPYRPAVFDPAWRSEAAVALAKSMDSTCTFDAMPILADALQEAGCDSPDILQHCRGESTHFRGCWVVDTVLGNDRTEAEYRW